jgi:pentatricopeptide repeat protein
LVAGFVDGDAAEEAFECTQAMQADGVSPDAVTFVSALKACCSIGSPDKGREAHAAIVRLGFLDADLASGNALIDMYGKCGCLPEAARVFEGAPSRDVVSWTTIMAAYCEHEQGSKALESLARMPLEGVVPNSATFLCGLKACRD